MTKRRTLITVSIVLVVCAMVVLGLWLWTRMGTPPPVVTPPAEQKDSRVCIDALPDRIKIGQKLLFAVYGTQLKAETPVLKQAEVGGVITMDALTASQIRQLKKSMNLPPLIAVDQEGGTVQRYAAEGVLPGASDMAKRFSTTQAYDAYLKDAQYLKTIGITTNFSPVVDVISGAQNPLPGRLYSSKPNIVSDYAAAAIQAAQDAGIQPVMKHFPGLGSASANTDFGSATTDPLSVLKTRDLIPYERLASKGVDVMVNNAIVPGLTAGKPAVWSENAVRLLRDMGYQQALVYSDSLTARAIPGTLADAVVKAWRAGIDIAVIVQAREETPGLASSIKTIVERARKALASGELEEKAFSDSLVRIFARKHIDPCQLSAIVKP